MSLRLFYSSISFHLTLCMLGIFYDIFFKITLTEKKSFRHTIRVSHTLDPDQARHNVGPDLGQNCLL